MSQNVYDTLNQMGVTLPPPPKPAASYVPAVRSGSLVFLSGHIARHHGHPWVGRLGSDVSTEEGQTAARFCAIDLLSTLHDTIGDLNKVRRIVKLVSLVNSADDFTEQHLVTNGASDFLGQVFGERGLHARSAFGAVQLPMGVCVEIEMIVEVE